MMYDSNLAEKRTLREAINRSLRATDKFTFHRSFAGKYSVAEVLEPLQKPLSITRPETGSIH
jgi:hypothetical protein